MNKTGETPAVGMCNPKYAHNVGMVLRLCSCYGFKQLWWSGKRVSLDIRSGERLPREERMKEYRDVEMVRSERFFDMFDRNVTPVAIEVRNNSESLAEFTHPENPLYVFGPEDGSIPSHILGLCHRFVQIPTAHCLNLATAVSTVMYDRKLKRIMLGLEPSLPPRDYLNEHRGYVVDADEVFRGISDDGLGVGHKKRNRL